MHPNYREEGTSVPKCLELSVAVTSQSVSAHAPHLPLVEARRQR